MPWQRILLAWINLLCIRLTYFLRMCASICCSHSRNANRLASEQIWHSLIIDTCILLFWLQSAQRQLLNSFFELEAPMRFIKTTLPPELSLSIRQWSSMKNEWSSLSLDLNELDTPVLHRINKELTIKGMLSPSRSYSFDRKSVLPVLSYQPLANEATSDNCTYQGFPATFQTEEWIASSANKNIAHPLQFLHGRFPKAKFLHKFLCDQDGHSLRSIKSGQISNWFPTSINVCFLRGSVEVL